MTMKACCSSKSLALVVLGMAAGFAIATPPLYVAAPDAITNARGNWQGTATQFSADGSETQYPVTLIITDKNHIAIDYPSLDCESTLLRLPTSDGHAEYTEKLNIHTQNCFDGGLVTLVPHQEDSTTLDWSWKMRFSGGDLVYATAPLSRTPPDEPQTLEFFRQESGETKADEP